MEEYKTRFRNSGLHWNLAWIVFVIFFAVPDIITQSKLAYNFHAFIFFIYLAGFFRLGKYKNNFSAFKVGKATYVPSAIVMVFLFPLLLSDIRTYAMEKVYLTKVRDFKLQNKTPNKKNQAALKEEIETVDLGLKVLAFPSKLIGTMLTTVFSSIEPTKSSGACYQLFYDKLQDSISGQISFPGITLSNGAKNLEGTDTVRLLLSMDMNTLTARADHGVMDRIQEERSHSRALTFGKLTCKSLVAYYDHVVKKEEVAKVE